MQVTYLTEYFFIFIIKIKPMHKLLDYFESHMLSCMYKKYLGVECPWCGIQRSLYLLLKGEIKESFLTFPALLPILGMLLFLIIHLIFKIRNGHKILLSIFTVDAAIIVTSYIIKIISN